MVSASLPVTVQSADTPPWLAALALSYEPAEQAAIQQAWDWLHQQAIDTTHSESVAALLSELHFDAASVSAALLCALPAEKIDYSKLAARFGADVSSLLQGLTRIAQIEQLAQDDSAEAQGASAGAQRVSLENLRKMLLAMAQDVRVVVIKLADRVCRMRAATALPENEQRELGRQTMDLFAPLANRLGIWQLKWELEDLAFRFLDAEQYRAVAKLLDEKRVDRARYIDLVIDRLKSELQANGLAAEVSGRPKHIYSIYKKLKHKAIDFDALRDISAVRILVAQVRDCYTVLGIVHNLWQPISGEFDDYISHPKANLYRSLHTAVIGPEGKPVEVQIRTPEMHREAELGIAAHWRYKEGGKAQRSDDEKIVWLRQLLDWNKERAAREHDRPDSALFDNRIFVLTPQGRVLDLPKGATPVDFAYELHTELGHRCRGAKVDGHIVPLDYQLQNAQRVEIITTKQGGPSRDWLMPALGYLHTSRALAKVRQWFKQQELSEAISLGRAMFDKELQRAGAGVTAIEALAQQLHFAKGDEMLAALGRGELSSRQLQSVLAPVAPEVPSAETPLPQQLRPATTTSPGILVLGVNNIATMLAKCCKPLPPEPIVGFVSKNRGVVVHRRSCANLATLSEQQAERLMPADWGQRASQRFPVELAIEADDRQGLLRDVSELLTREKVNVLAVNTLSRGLHARMLFTVELTDYNHLLHLITVLKSVSGVTRVARA